VTTSVLLRLLSPSLDIQRLRRLLMLPVQHKMVFFIRKVPFCHQQIHCQKSALICILLLQQTSSATYLLLRLCQRICFAIYLHLLLCQYTATLIHLFLHYRQTSFSPCRLVLPQQQTCLAVYLYLLLLKDHQNSTAMRFHLLS
jgi:hypothetical protein